MGLNLHWCYIALLTATTVGCNRAEEHRSRASVPPSHENAAASRPVPHESPQSESVVISKIPTPPRFPVQAVDFASLKNPHGEGVVVFIPNRTRFNGVERRFAWFVLNNTVYNLNGATAALTPDLPWTREASTDDWSNTGLDLTGSRALQVAFPED